MKLQELAALVALCTLAVDAYSIPNSYPNFYQKKHSHCVYKGTDNPEVDVTIQKWDNAHCDGNPDASHEVHHGKCNNMNYGFSSFTYSSRAGLLWDDNDGKDCRCFVFVHPEHNCQGTPACVGPIIDGAGSCHSLAHFPVGLSAIVRCDDGKETRWRDECSNSPLYEFVPPEKWEAGKSQDGNSYDEENTGESDGVLDQDLPVIDG